MRAQFDDLIEIGALFVGSILLCPASLCSAGTDSLHTPTAGAARTAASALYDSARAVAETDPTASLHCALRGLAISRSGGDLRLQALGCQLTGEAYFQRGENDSSEAYHLRALDLARAAVDDSLTAAALNSGGLMAYMRGDPTVALQLGFEALSIAQRSGNRILTVRIDNHLGLAARDFGASVSDIGFFRRALAEAIALGDSEGIAITRNHLGSWLATRGSLDSALIHYGASLAYRMRTAPGSNSVAVLDNNIGNVYRSQRRYREAEESYRKSHAISMRTGSRNLIATTYKNMAILARDQGDHARALDYARKAEAISLSIGLSRIAILSAQEIPPNLAAQGNFHLAYDSLVAFIRLRDSLDNERNERHLAELQVRFESDRKEQIIQQLALEQARSVRNFLIAFVALSLLLGIVLYFLYREKSSAARELAARQKELEHLNAALMARNEQLQSSESHLRDSLQEKEVLLKEIHHRVKNNLQVVSSLLSLQSDGLTDDTSRALLLDSQDRIRAMALVHERLYRSGTFMGIELADYLADLMNHLQASHGSRRVRIDVSSDPVSVNIDAAIPLGLIVSELVTNAFKHAFPGDTEGTVQVIARSIHERECVLTVADNGQGLPPPPDDAGESTLGLQLVHILVEQIEGHLEITNNGGTRFDVRFPLTPGS